MHGVCTFACFTYISVMFAHLLKNIKYHPRSYRQMLCGNPEKILACHIVYMFIDNELK